MAYPSRRSDDAGGAVCFDRVDKEIAGGCFDSTRFFTGEGVGDYNKFILWM